MMAPLSPPTRHLLSTHRRLRTSWTVILAVFVCFASHALAAVAGAPVETLVVDHRLPYREGRGWAMLSEHDVQQQEMRKRAASEQSESESPESSKSPMPTSTKSPITTTFSIVVGTQKPSTTSTTAAASPLPSILDSMSVNSNGVTASCLTFISTFLANSTFKECYPLSMLFDGSRSFFEAQRSVLGVTRTLDATCAANATTCNTYLAGLARDLVSAENCGTDYRKPNPSVVAAHDAMVAYSPIYTAGCLRDQETSAYCYANAVTNTTNPSGVYFYRLPLNRTLPSTTVPACGYCLQQTMAFYQAATADRRQMIASTYVDAAKHVNLICGPDFSNETLAAEIASNGGASGQASTRLAAALPLLAAVLWLV